MIKVKSLLLMFLLVLLSACGTVERGTIPWEEEPKRPDVAVSGAGVEGNDESGADESADPEIRERQEFLELAYRDWEGVPYMLGGGGYEGIDCSAFMQVVFEDYFSLTIPRTTKEQLVIGESIKKSELKTGDLVFFKTGSRTYHVGVMMNSREFLHASTTAGVTTSDINRDFWQETYLSARRIF